MKSFTVYILLFALIGGVLSARFRRQASAESLESPESAESPDSPESAESPESPESPETVPDTNGLDIALNFLKADPESDPAAVNLLESIQAQNKAAKDAAAAKKPAGVGPPAA